MIRNIGIALLLVIGTAISSPAADTVKFEAKSTTMLGDPVMLTGTLTKPQGDGPFPGVVLLHDCLGPMPEYEEPWVERLTRWGYVTFRVDSFGPRGESSACIKLLVVAPWTRAQEAHDAKSYLARLPFVDNNKIAVMGSGTGGWAALHTVDKGTSIEGRENPFRAAVTLYPYCHAPQFDPDAPVLILIGELTEMFSAEKCLSMINTGETARDVILKIYPGTHYAFDFEGGKKIESLGEIPIQFGEIPIQYDPEAAADAIARVKDFLDKYLK